MSRSDLIQGALWAAAAAAFHSLVPVGVRLLSDTMEPIQIVFYRNAMGLMFFLALFSWRGFSFLKTRHLGLHLQRNVANFVGMWLWFAAIASMPIAKAIALHFTEPMFATLLAVVILKERPGALRIAALLAGFVGVMIVLRPGAIPIGWPALMVLGSAALYATLPIYSRILGRSDPPSTTTFYYQAMLTAFAFFPSLPVWVWPVWGDAPALLLLAAAGTAAPYCIIRAVRHAEASVVSPMGFLRLPLTAGLAFLLFGEPTDVWTWVGAAVIFGAAYVATHGAARSAGRRR